MITLEDALATGYGTWRSFDCPSHEASHPTARVNVLTGKWVCMSCGAKGSAENYEPDPDRLLDAALKAVDEMDKRRDYPESWLDQFDHHTPGAYWLSRFSEATCRIYRLGWDSLEKQAVYPFRDDDGTVLGVVRRARPGEHPKYRYPPGVDAHKHLFGYHLARFAEVLVLTEGAPDAAAVTDVADLLALETGMTWAPLGCYGKVLHPAQITLIHRLRPRYIVLGFNGDDAGERGQWVADQRLGRQGLIAHQAELPPTKDLGDLSPVRRMRTLLQALAVSPLTV
jgi:hypothetical protein